MAESPFANLVKGLQRRNSSASISSSGTRGSFATEISIRIKAQCKIVIDYWCFGALHSSKQSVLLLNLPFGAVGSSRPPEIGRGLQLIGSEDSEQDLVQY
eukprot:g18581.t1